MKNVIIIFIIISLIIFAMNTSNAQEQRPFTITGHRGASAQAPENTLASIQKALDAGVDRIEIDVRLTEDGQIVLMHDRTLSRTTDGKGRVKDFSLEHIRTLDAGSWFGTAFKGERVPLLDEVIKKINGRCELLIEVKEDSRYEAGIESKVIELIRANHAEKWCIVISFRHRVLDYIHKNAPEIRLQKLYLGKVPLLPLYIDAGLTFWGVKKYSYAEEFNVNRSFASRCLIRKVKKQGKKINVWTENELQHARKLLRRGIDGLMTNDPEYFAKELKSGI